MKKFFGIVAVVLLLVLCVLFFYINKINQPSLPFPVSINSEKMAQYKFEDVLFDLTPIKEYQFSIPMVDGWKFLNSTITEEIPENDQVPVELAVIQKRDLENNIDAQMLVYVVRFGSDKKIDNMKEYIVDNYGSSLVTIEDYNNIGFGNDNQDILFTYKDGNKIFVSRVSTKKIPSKENDYAVIQAIVNKENYEEYADMFYKMIKELHFVN